MKAATGGFATTPDPVTISIHAAREGGDQSLFKTVGMIRISIHAAREGGDALRKQDRHKAGISIHAAREGGDEVGGGLVAIELHFNPRRP